MLKASVGTPGGIVIARTSLFIGLLALAHPAWPCSVVRPLPTPAQLVDDATVIVIARARGVSREPRHSGSLPGSSTQVEFDVVEILKGTLTQASLRFDGTLLGDDDPLDRSTSYDFVQPGGRGGECFAVNYVRGVEYLLLLRPTGQAYDQQTLTPYWAPLRATNDRVRGTHDRWVAWVRQRVRSKSGA